MALWMIVADFKLINGNHPNSISQDYSSFQKYYHHHFQCEDIWEVHRRRLKHHDILIKKPRRPSNTLQALLRWRHLNCWHTKSNATQRTSPQRTSPERSLLSRGPTVLQQIPWIRVQRSLTVSCSSWDSPCSYTAGLWAGPSPLQGTHAWWEGRSSGSFSSVRSSPSERGSLDPERHGLKREQVI